MKTLLQVVLYYNLFKLSVQLLKMLLTSGCCQLQPFSLSSYSCPGTNITYTCVISLSNSSPTVTTWIGSAFQCPSTNSISLLQKTPGGIQPFTPVSCGSLSAVTTNISTDGTCYTSVLTIPAVRALNGTTVVCVDGTGAVVGNDTLKIISEICTMFPPLNAWPHMHL